MRNLLPVIAASLSTLTLYAHEVVWNPGHIKPEDPANAMMLTVGGDGAITVQPSADEPCVVHANIRTPPSDLSSLVTITPREGESGTVTFKVHVQRPPIGATESVEISGFWSATGEPKGNGCSGSGGIMVTVTVSASGGGGTPPALLTTAQTGNSADTRTDPISTATGELYSLMDPDFSGLRLQRYYGSLLKANGVSTALGANWMHNYDLSLAATGSDATVTLFRGRKVRFAKTVAGWQLDRKSVV